MLTLFKDIKNGTSHSVEYLDSDNLAETLSAHGIRVRKVFAPLLRIIYTFQTGYRLKIDNCVELPRSDIGRIYAINHRQGDDVVLGVKAAKQPGFIVFGNPYLAFDTMNGLGLWAYGMILVRRCTRSSREAAYEKMKYVLERGGNIFIYPEGYWNLDDNGERDARHAADAHNSENWLLQDFNVGMFRLAREIGCEIVPVVLHYDEHVKKHCHASLGNPFTVGKYDDVFIKKEELHSIMLDTYYMLMEKYSAYKRSELESCGISLHEQWRLLKRKLIADCSIPRIGYELDLEDEKRIGKAKVVCSVVTSKEAFAHLKTIEPTKNNAFLFNKRLS